MTFHASTIDLINIVCLAAGAGVCGMIFLQISQSLYLEQKLKRTFQLFCVLLAVNLIAQLIVSIFLGHPGDVIHTMLPIAYFVDFTVGGFASYIISQVVLGAAKPGGRAKLYKTILCVIIGLHVLIMTCNLFTSALCYFDEANEYHRTSLYFLTNLGIVLMLLFDTYLLVRYRQNIDSRVRTAFWVYICAPILGILLQTLFYGFQLILIATIIASVYVSLTLLRDQTEKYEAQKAAGSRIETELNMAAEIQTKMLPNTFPAFPARSEFDIYASMATAREVGGDFYDFFMTDDDHLVMVMADVSGKGVPAALFMMTARTMIKDASQSGMEPSSVLRYVNAQICENNPEDMFVTVWLGFLELSSGKLVWSDAGHEKLLLCRNGVWELVAGGGIALGVLEPAFLGDDDPFEDHTLRLSSGDALFQYTDGVTEAMTAEREQFGTDRLIDALTGAPSSSPEELLSHVRARIDAFVKNAEQYDDITMLALRYRGIRSQDR